MIRVLKRHQQKAIAFALKLRRLYGHLRVGLYMAPGVGKTIVAIRLAVRYAGPKLILCRRDDFLTWKNELAAEGHDPGRVLFVESGKDDPFPGRMYDWVCVTYDLMRNKRIRDSIKRSPFSVVVADECVAPWSKVHTPNGMVRIDQIKSGDLVMGVNHDSGKPCWATVKATSINVAGPCVRIGESVVSDNHPVWTSTGYTRADSLTRTDKLCVIKLRSGNEKSKTIRSSMPMVPEEVQVLQKDSKILRNNLFREMENVSARVRKQTMDSRAKRSDARACKPAKPGPEVQSEDEKSNGPLLELRSKPIQIEESRNTCQSQKESESSRVLLVERRKWQRAHQSSSDISKSFEMAHGICGKDSTASPIPQQLQAGHSERKTKDCSRGRWGYSRNQEGKDQGRQERPVSASIRLDRAEVLERGSLESFAPSPEENTNYVYNLETSTGNFFVEGVLTHNCHLLKRWKSQRTKAAYRATRHVPNRLGLTGSNITNDVKDIFSQVLFLDDGRTFGDSEFWFMKRHFFKVDFAWYPKKGLKDTIAKGLRKIAFHVHEDDVLALPPVRTLVKGAPMSGMQRRHYEKMLAEWEYELDGESIEIDQVIVQLMKLRQIASGFMYKEDGTPVLFKCPKMELLFKDLSDPDAFGLKSKLIIWCSHTAEINRICDRATAEGISNVRFVGTMKTPERVAARERFRDDPKLRLFVGQVDAGVGMNELIVADTAIYYSNSLKVVSRQQSMRRNRRIGSEKHASITYVDYVTEGTVDESLTKSVKSDMNFAQSVMDKVKRGVALRDAI